MKPTIVIIGDSHIVAFNEANREPGEHGAHIICKMLGGGRNVRTEFFKVKTKFLKIVDPEYSKSLRKIPWPPFTENCVYAFLFGLFGGFAWGDGKWSKLIPFELRKNDGPFASRALIAATIDDHCYWVQSFFLAAQSLKLPFMIVEGPAPFRHRLRPAGIPVETAAFLERTYKSAMKEWLSSRGIPCVEIPKTCLDDVGLMREEFRHENPLDGHHANTAFGKLMLSQIRKTAREHFAIG